MFVPVLNIRRLGHLLLGRNAKRKRQQRSTSFQKAWWVWIGLTRRRNTPLLGSLGIGKSRFDKQNLPQHWTLGCIVFCLSGIKPYRSFLYLHLNIFFLIEWYISCLERWLLGCVIWKWNNEILHTYMNVFKLFMGLSHVECNTYPILSQFVTGNRYIVYFYLWPYAAYIVVKWSIHMVMYGIDHMCWLLYTAHAKCFFKFKVYKMCQSLHNAAPGCGTFLHLEILYIFYI